MKIPKSVITRRQIIAALYGAAVSLVTALIMIAVISLMLLKETIVSDLEQYCVMLILFLSSLAGAIITRIRAGEGEALACVIGMLVNVLMLTVISLLAFDGPTHGFFPKCLLIVCGNIFLLFRKKKAKRGVRYKKYRIPNS